MPTSPTFTEAKARVEAGDLSFEAIAAMTLAHGRLLVREYDRADMGRSSVRLGALSISMAEALEHYRSLRHDPDRDDDVQSEIVALWNAIQAADKRSKGLPTTRLPFNPRTAAAVERLVRKIA